jgi:putative copper export protein
MIDDAGGMLTVALRFVMLTATTGALGGWIFARFVLQAAVEKIGAAKEAELRALSGRIAAACTALIALTTPPRLVQQARAVSEAGDPLWPTIWNLLTTHWGVALIIQTTAALVATVALVRALGSRTRSRAAEGAVMLLAVGPAFLGHAFASESWTVVSVIVDIAHVASAGGWVGALAILTTVALRHRRHEDGPRLVASLIIAFHPVAMVCAATVISTGLATAWLRMGVPEGIANPTYSGLFVAKLLIVGVTAALGAGHSKKATKRVQTVEMTSIGRSLLGESLLAVLVLVVTAVLAGTAPIG